jgi:two-component system chemotaxis response regulator CheB
MVTVLLVDDSEVELEFLQYLLESDPEFNIIGKAKNGEEAIEFLSQKKPDVITMDVHMPKMDGYEATKKIMEINPVPIVIVSGSTSSDVDKTYKAISAGALAFVQKPVSFDHPDFDKVKTHLIQTVKSMSEVKVVKRWTGNKLEDKSLVSKPFIADNYSNREFSIVVIGVSTGGPAALNSLLSKLPKNFPIPVVIVQHIAAGFLNGLVEWLSKSTELNYMISADDEILRPGFVYFAPDDYQLAFSKSHRVKLTKDEPENGLRPSISFTFRSAANTYKEKAVGILLTGMGKDGATELKLMKDFGALTIAQDKESSVVFGMPNEAIKLDAATHILPPEKIATLLSVLNIKNQ